jgi:hypothetical protein
LEPESLVRSLGVEDTRRATEQERTAKSVVLYTPEFRTDTPLSLFLSPESGV